MWHGSPRLESFAGPNDWLASAQISTHLTYENWEVDALPAQPIKR